MGTTRKINARMLTPEQYIADHRLDLMRRLFPKTLAAFGPLDWGKTIAPVVLEAPLDLLQQAKLFISTVFELSRRPEYRNHYLSAFDSRWHRIPNQSVLMAYDFHVDAAGRLRLVEINTNASGFLLSQMGLRLWSERESEQSLAELRASFVSELACHGGTFASLPRVAIVDQDIVNQKMFAEFLMYRELFERWGLKAEIVDLKDLRPGAFDWIYNRLTDFYLASPQSADLAEAWLDRRVVLTPQPVEYLLLADKRRLLDFQDLWIPRDPGLSSISEHLMTAQTLSDHNAEAMWSRRKSLFFKPLSSFGGKGAYRGEGISRRKFDELIGRDTLAQEFVPAPTVELNGSDWKYDLRFYVYRDHIQYVAGRIYRGQVTNFSHDGGGFCCVDWN